MNGQPQTLWVSTGSMDLDVGDRPAVDVGVDYQDLAADGRRLEDQVGGGVMLACL